MPLWTTRSSIWRAVSASYAFSGGCRSVAYTPTPGWAAQIRALVKANSPQSVLTNRRLPEPRQVKVSTGLADHQPLPADLEARIAARVKREAAQRTLRRVTLRPAAVKANGGLRGSTATRWSR